MQCYLAGKQAELLVYYYSVSLEAVLKSIIADRKRERERKERKPQQLFCLHIPCFLS